MLILAHNHRPEPATRTPGAMTCVRSARESQYEGARRSRRFTGQQILSDRTQLRCRPTKRRKRRAPAATGLLACLLFLFLGEEAFPASMTAHFDRDTVAVGESVTLTLTFEGVTPSAPPNLPPLPNAQISYSGQS